MTNSDSNRIVRATNGRSKRRKPLTTLEQDSMSVHTINLQPIDIRQAGEQDYAALNRFDNIMRAERIGAKRALEESISQLRVSQLKRELIEQWIAAAQNSASDFELGFWLGAYPEEDLNAICELMDVMNTAPRGELDMEDWHLTPE